MEIIKYRVYDLTDRMTEWEFEEQWEAERHFRRLGEKGYKHRRLLIQTYTVTGVKYLKSD